MLMGKTIKNQNQIFCRQADDDSHRIPGEWFTRSLLTGTFISYVCLCFCWVFLVIA